MGHSGGWGGVQSRADGEQSYIIQTRLQVIALPVSALAAAVTAAAVASSAHGAAVAAAAAPTERSSVAASRAARCAWVRA